jgi:hypothetical protein
LTKKQGHCKAFSDFDHLKLSNSRLTAAEPAVPILPFADRSPVRFVLLGTGISPIMKLRIIDITRYWEGENYGTE